uniref:Pyrin domain-containing protein n=1 Tax=Astyanax mexicanus TaxID=7994 RepID=A0A8B9GV94_ASTMX
SGSSSFLVKHDECDIKTFQWYLNNGIKEFRPIPKAQLENADRTDMVDIIVQCYKGNGAVDITLSILRKMNKNQQLLNLNAA